MSNSTTVSIFHLDPPEGYGFEDNAKLNRALEDPSVPGHDEAMLWFRHSFRGPYDPRLNYRLAFTYAAEAQDPEAMCEVAFHEFNVGTGPLATRYRALRSRSLSTGDVVGIGSEAWECQSFGWGRLDGVAVVDGKLVPAT